MAMGMGIALGAISLRFAGSIGPGVVTLESFHIAFVLMFTLALVALIDFRPLSHTAGESVRMRKLAKEPGSSGRA